MTMKDSAGKCVSGWMILELFASLIIFMGITLYASTDYYTLSTPYEHIRSACKPEDVAAKAAAIIPNYSRNHSVFLQLSDYFWVKNPSLYSLPYGTKGSEQLIMQVLALTNHYHIPQEIDRLQCRRCVVVGNGYSMKSSSLGEIIDKYDMVIRLNNAPVHNYERDVGSKTTLRFFYPESAHFDPILDNNPESLMVLVPFKSSDLTWLKTILNDEKRIRKGFWRRPPLIWNVKPENIRILNPYFMKSTATNLLMFDHKAKRIPIKPTTGLIAISLAIHFCDLVHIAGFGYPASSTKTHLIHYYDKLTLKHMAGSGHKVPLEAILIKKLLQDNIIQSLTHF